MDLVIRNARFANRPRDVPPEDIGIENGRIVAIGPGLAADAEATTPTGIWPVQA